MLEFQDHCVTAQACREEKDRGYGESTLSAGADREQH